MVVNKYEGNTRLYKGRSVATENTTSKVTPISPSFWLTTKIKIAVGKG